MWHIITSRLLISPIKKEDIQKHHELLFSDPKVMEKYAEGKPRDFRTVNTLLGGYVQAWQEGNPYSYFSVFVKKPKQFIGTVFVTTRNQPKNIGNLGYVFCEKVWGNGYATEALVPLLFGYIPLIQKKETIHTIGATVRADNGASRHILEKLGFSRRDSIIKFETERLKYVITLPELIAVEHRFRVSYEYDQIRFYTDKSYGNEEFILVQDLKNKFQEEISEKALVDTQIQKWISRLYKTTILLGGVDTTTDGIRLYQTPTLGNANKVIISVLHLYSAVSGFNTASIAAAGISSSYTYYENGLYPTIQQTLTSLSFMLLPMMLKNNHTYLSLLFSVTMVGYSVYHSISNIQSLYQENFGINQNIYKLKSYEAWLTGAKWFAEMTSIVFFSDKASEYEVKARALKLSIEKQSREIQLKTEQGEDFGGKLFKYIYEPFIEDKHIIENQLLTKSLKQHDAEKLLASKLVSIPDTGYEVCRPDNNSNELSNIEDSNYYCANGTMQTIDYVSINNSVLTVVGVL